MARLTRPHGALLNSEEEDALLEEDGQSEFDTTECMFLEEVQTILGELPYEDLFKDTEDCGPKVNKSVEKRVNSACTIRPEELDERNHAGGAISKCSRLRQQT